jgi:hypothetical protein
MTSLLRVLCALAILGAVVAPQASAQCLISGYYESVPTLQYSCAFGIIDWAVSTWIVEDLGNGEISVTPGPGPLPVLLGTIDCEALQFTATGTVGGTCGETYTLSGVILSEVEWSGWFSADYAGINCFDCTYQFWSIGGGANTAVADGRLPTTWSTIKALYGRK